MVGIFWTGLSATDRVLKKDFVRLHVQTDYPRYCSWKLKDYLSNLILQKDTQNWLGISFVKEYPEYLIHDSECNRELIAQISE
jgi:hypothetical protein